jgi:DNA-binding LytR/AlgR family response regulator
MIRAYVADDEVLALDRMRDLLGRFADVEIVGTGGGGRAALEEILALAPDVVLLDIEMPGLDGFGIVEALARADAAKPLVIFVTAFPRFAVPAFDTGAIDFLTKPVRFSRLETAMDRLRQALDDRSANQRLAELSSQIEALRRGRDSESGGPRHLWVQSRGESIRLDLDEVERVEGEGEYVRLFLPHGSYLHRDSVSRMAERLNPDRFVRVHRSHIVNRRRLVGIRRRTTGSYQLITAGGAAVPVGRSYRAVVRTIVADGPAERP